MSVKVALLCPGLGRSRRGYERFAAELYEAVRDSADITLYRGSSDDGDSGDTIGGLSRDGLTARVLGSVSHDRFYWEAVSFAHLAWRRIRSFDVVHYSEPPLNLAFARIERGSRGPRRLFSHALNMDAQHTLRCHHIHQTSPVAFAAAQDLGVPADRMTLLPYGVDALRLTQRHEQTPHETRQKYGLPYNSPVVICVAAINRVHKRIDHLVAEVATLESRPHLLLCGALEDETLLADARRTLGESNVTHLYVSQDEILDLYGAADLCVLPSLIEGFGLALVEAQLSGLPVIAHDSDHFRWLLGEGARLCVDMKAPGALAQQIRITLGNLDAEHALSVESRAAQAERYDWPRLIPSYVAMYEKAVSHSNQLIESLVS